MANHSTDVWQAGQAHYPLKCRITAGSLVGIGGWCGGLLFLALSCSLIANLLASVLSLSCFRGLPNELPFCWLGYSSIPDPFQNRGF